MLEDEALKEAFYGRKYKKFRKNNFSIPALIFGGNYFLYRKMIVQGIIFTIVSTLILDLFINLMDWKIVTIAVVTFQLSLSLLFHSSYRAFTEKKVQKIKSENEGKTEDELIEICEKAGGTSKKFVVISVLLQILVVSIILLMAYWNVVSEFFSENNSNENNNVSQIEENQDASNTISDNDELNSVEEDTNTTVEDTSEYLKNPKYAGKVEYDNTINISDYITIKKMPSDFNKDVENLSENILKYNYKPKENGTNIDIEIAFLKYYDDAKFFIETYSDYIYPDADNVIEETPIDNIDWYVFRADTSYIAVANIGEKVLYFSYKAAGTFIGTFKEQNDYVKILQNYSNVINAIKLK